MVMRDDHRDAQDAAQQAEALVRRGDLHRARSLYNQAAQAEARALAATPVDKPRTYSILAVSVVALWYKARAFDQAEAAAFRALAAEQTNEWARAQLRELLEATWNERDMLAQGLGDIHDRILVSLTGGQVGYGSAPLGLAVQAQNAMSSLVTRVAEWLGGFPLRRRGSPSPDLLAVFQLRIATAQPGSYKFAIDLAGAEQPELFGSRVKVGDVADKVMDFIASAVGPVEDLERSMPDADYRTALLQLLHGTAPNGKNFGELGVCRQGRDLEPRLVLVDREARERIGRSIRHEQIIDTLGGEVRGVLRALNLDQGSLTIVDDEGKSTPCQAAPGMLDDVVGPWVNTRVVVRGKLVAGKLVAVDIHPDDGE